MIQPSHKGKTFFDISVNTGQIFMGLKQTPWGDEPPYVKMPHCWNSHAAAQIQSYYDVQYLVGKESTRLTVKVLA